MKRYVISDIHGCLCELCARIVHLEQLGFFSEGCEDELIFLGDYIDRGPDSLGVMQEVMELQRRCSGRVVALLGNHEDEFLRWLGDAEVDWNDDVLLDDLVFELLDGLTDSESISVYASIDRMLMWQRIDQNVATMRSFLGSESFETFERKMEKGLIHATAAFEDACKHIKSKYFDVVCWLRGLDTFYETEQQIFVHAEIDETSGHEWLIATPRDVMLAGRSLRFGTFYKDVVAGHTPTSLICGDESFKGVLWDGESHFYIDGMTISSGYIPVLVYDTTKHCCWELDGEGSLTSISPRTWWSA